MTNQAAQTMPDSMKIAERAQEILGETPDRERIAIRLAQLEFAALSQTAGVPPGWKLVPVEPTEAMRAAFDGVPLDLDDMLFQQRVSMGKEPGVTHVEQVSPAIHRHEFHKRYRAMLAAAPAASGGDAAASVSERARELRERAEAHGGGVFVSIGDIRVIEQALTQQRGECVDAAGVLRWAASVLYMWEGDPNETGYMGDFKDAEEILHLLADHATTTPQPSADAVRDDRCRHENGSPGHDHWRCRDCGAFKTDSGWGVASHRYFNSRSEAEFYREHGRLPEHAGPQPWGNDHQQNAAQGGESSNG